MFKTYVVCDICGKTVEAETARTGDWFLELVDSVSGEMRIVCSDHLHGLTKDDVRAMWLAEQSLIDCDKEVAIASVDECFNYMVGVGLLNENDKEMYEHGAALLQRFVLKRTARAVYGQHAILWEAVPLDSVAVLVDSGFIATKPAVRLVYAVLRD